MEPWSLHLTVHKYYALFSVFIFLVQGLSTQLGLMVPKSEPQSLPLPKQALSPLSYLGGQPCMSSYPTSFSSLLLWFRIIILELG